MIREIVGVIVGGILILFSLVFLYLGLTVPVIVATPYLILFIIFIVPSFFVFKWAFKKKQPTKPVEPIRRICPHCGRVLKEDTKFCPYCGKKLSEIGES